MYKDKSKYTNQDIMKLNSLDESTKKHILELRKNT